MSSLTRTASKPLCSSLPRAKNKAGDFLASVPGFSMLSLPPLDRAIVLIQSSIEGIIARRSLVRLKPPLCPIEDRHGDAGKERHGEGGTGSAWGLTLFLAWGAAGRSTRNSEGGTGNRHPERTRPCKKQGLTPRGRRNGGKAKAGRHGNTET